MQLEKVEKLITADAVTIRSTVNRRIGRNPFELYYRFFGMNPDFVDDSADPFAAALLIKAMRAKETLEILPPISARLHFMLPRIRNIYHAWWPKTMARIEIRTTPRRELAFPEKRAATFFSGGVDSFYSLLKHWSEGRTRGWPLTHLIFMRGIETKLSLTKGIEKSEEWVRAVARDLEIEPIFGVTNIRDHLLTHWEKYDHGSALASVALCLTPLLGCISIPSDSSYNDLVATGSSPLTDEMFSTERMHILHDGSEVTRAEKLPPIMSWRRSLALQYLRVCYKNSGGAYNCGRCIKCVRTVIPLHVMGLLQHARTFPNNDRTRWETTMAKDHPLYIRENLEFALRHGGHLDLVSMLTRMMERLEIEQATKSIEAWRPPAQRLINPSAPIKRPF